MNVNIIICPFKHKESYCNCHIILLKSYNNKSHEREQSMYKTNILPHG